jgi:hypothetical protein
LPNVRKYLNQSITLKRQQLRPDGTPRTSGYGEPLFDSPETLDARVVEKQNVRRNPQGEEILASTEVWTAEEVNVGDYIDGRSIEARSNVVDKRGTAVLWTSYL